MTENNKAPILDVRNLKTYFPVRRGIFKKTVGYLKAVDDISFFVRPGETLGLVGESGCGKTTAARSILRLIEPTFGEIIFNGMDLLNLLPVEMRSIRQDMQVIFQDPYASLNPRMNVTSIIGEGLRIHENLPWSVIRDRVADLMEEVGLSKNFINRYPHEFSGGQRQRIGVARALAMKPDFIICDEAVSALDVSIQAQIINLLENLQDQYGFAYLFIAHDLSVVEHISDRVAVMYLGKIVETAPSEELYRNPNHPYTIALLNSVPIPDPSRRKEFKKLSGQVPSLANLPTGCRFHTRCEKAKEICRTTEPPEIKVSENHTANCHMI